MVVKLFGSPVSTCTARVMLCMEEIGLQYELVPVDLKAGEHQRPPHSDRNPFCQIPALQDGGLVLFGEGFLCSPKFKFATLRLIRKPKPFCQIPALQDGGLVLFESRVITRYLVQKYGKGTYLLKQKSFVDTVAVDQWMEVETQHFNGPISAIVFQHVFLPLLFGGHTDQNVVLLDLDKLGKVLDVYEARLSKTKFLAGDFYSLADLHHLPYGYHLINNTPHGSLINSRPHVKAWWDAITSRQGSKKVLAAMASTS
ncbi:probable glutathione S-transferase GSTF1 [Dendrobium catenatum]|uniref:probable glutathione S-transferase GSTF1 n=1 Tax=Dendrobium catenatum TaxID=906689 RepID=UPI00109FC934|nr:probable glutathione S-transferase GSTF1 [Dendrobium catenatum]